jgi:hypothetical protein
MSAEKLTKSVLFYVVLLCLFLSYFFTTCVGDELDELDRRLTAVEEQLAQIQAKVDASKWVTEITNDVNGFTIHFSDGTTVPLTNGRDGIQGKAGTSWFIREGFWGKLEDGVETITGYQAIGKDGKPGRSPQIVDGYWTIYPWNAESAKYDTITTRYMADTLSSYIVDMWEYYELHVPVQKRDENGDLVYDPPGDPTGKPVTEWKELKLPKWVEDPLVLNFLGYAYKSGDELRLIGDWNYEYRYMYPLLYPGGPGGSTIDSTSWVGETKSITNQWLFSFMINNDTLAVFKANKDVATVTGLTFTLEDTQGTVISPLKLGTPVRFTGLLTKASADSIYYAPIYTDSRDYSDAEEGAIKRDRGIYYRLATAVALGDTVRSNLAPTTIHIRRGGPVSESHVERVNYQFAVSDTFSVTKDAANRLGFDSDSANIYDFRFFEHPTPGTPRISSGPEGTFVINVVDTLQMVVYKLHIDGRVHSDTITIKSQP